jgi:hypothetical protein
LGISTQDQTSTPAARAFLGHQIAIGAVVVVLEEGPRTAVAALGHVMGKAWKDGAGEAGHAATLGAGPCNVN